ncbi:hypothetical protein D3C78_739060 [compost metagenome]
MPFSRGEADDAGFNVMVLLLPPVTAGEFTSSHLVLASLVAPGDTVITPDAGIIGRSKVSCSAPVVDIPTVPLAGDGVIGISATPFVEKLHTLPLEIPENVLLSTSLKA